jgi:hypothetical protein
VLPGGGRIVACLKAHAAQISPDCNDGLNRVSNLLER